MTDVLAQSSLDDLCDDLSIIQPLEWNFYSHRMFHSSSAGMRNLADAYSRTVRQEHVSETDKALVDHVMGPALSPIMFQ